MPRLIKTARQLTVKVSPEEQLLLGFRTQHGSWRAVLAWFRREASHRLNEVRPIINRLRAFERRHRIRLEGPSPEERPENEP